MGILEVHFHDSDFSWTVNPGESETSPLSSDGGTSSSGGPSGPNSGRPVQPQSPGQKLRMVAMLGILVGLGVAVTRLRNRRARKAAERQQESSGGRLSRLRSK